MKTLCIEVLYPEYNNLYGDRGNLTYLLKKLALCGCEITVIETHLGDTPAFAEKTVDFLYIGPCTEDQQERQLEALMPYREALSRRFEEGAATLLTGNAVELLGESIEKEDGTKIEALGLVNTCAKRFSRLRFNDLCVGEGDGVTVVGFKNQLSHSYPTGEPRHTPFLTMEKGCGLNPESKAEGVRNGGFVGTYLLGPLLPLNPTLTNCLLQRLLGEEPPACVLPFEEEAYTRRLAELRK